MNIRKSELQSRVSMLYYLVALAFFVWWIFGQVLVASGAIQTIPSFGVDVYRLVLAIVAFAIGMVRSRWRDIKTVFIADE